MAGKRRKHRIEVGDRIVVVAGFLRIRGQVVEDRGNLGVNGARVLGIVSDLGEGAHDVYRETAEHKLELVEPAA
jgi:hypothetical protein